jgi:TonB family protein
MRNRIAIAFLVIASMMMLAPGPAHAQEVSAGSRKVVDRVVPQYPTVARRMNIQGVVRLDVLVAPNGTVKSVDVRGGHPLLVQSAQSALIQWKWEPAPRETHETIELKFNP